MLNVIFDISYVDQFKAINFTLISGTTTPEEFASAVQKTAKEFVGPYVILLGGRGPVWAYGMMMHEAHASKAVATLDPRLGYVVVQSHCSEYKVGQVIAPPLVEG